MILNCDYCGKAFNKKPSALKAKNYCCKECWHNDKYTVLECCTCGKRFEKLNVLGIFEHNFCSRNCAKVFTSARMSDYNVKHNPNAMTIDRRTSLRNSHLNKGEGKTYTKTFGRHTHRVVAEQILGRPLKLGEVVHHINENKRDNRPENLMVFASQKLHAEWHQKIKRHEV